MPKPRPLISMCVLLVLLVSLALAACVRTASAGDSATPAATVAATPADAATSCNQLPGFAAATFLEISNVDIPEDGLGTGKITSPPNSPMEVDEYNACIQIRPPATPNPSGPLATVLAVINVSGRGWASTTTFPFDGTTPTACSPQQRCFRSGPGGSLGGYLLIENVAAHPRGLYTFHLGLALTAPLIACDPVLFPYDVYVSSVSPVYAAEIPLPPITRMSLGYNDGQNTTTYFCSAGTAASIVAFENKNLPKYGWTPVSFNGKQLWKTTHGTPTLYIQVLPVTNPRQWAVLEYGFDLHI